jgi:hypothetical protein
MGIYSPLHSFSLLHSRRAIVLAFAAGKNYFEFRVGEGAALFVGRLRRQLRISIRLLWGVAKVEVPVRKARGMATGAMDALTSRRLGNSAPSRDCRPKRRPAPVSTNDREGMGTLPQHLRGLFVLCPRSSPPMSMDRSDYYLDRARI